MEARRGDYGFDAPYVIVGFSLAALAALGLGVFGASLWVHIIGFGNFFWFSFSALSFLFTTRRGKFLVWSELLDGLSLKGNETILDVGCGRGAVLLLAAKKLPQGKAIGIDLWSTTDQSGNAEAVTQKNASLEGVEKQIELHTGDMRSMPFPDESFDVVVSSLAIHNIPEAAGRDKAITEIIRVLKKGGIALLADFRFTADYQACVEKHNVKTERRSLGWRFWYGGPHAATSLVTARKPA
jgi:arsenite methyltransferase